jgi:hypothetical protein
MFTNKRQSNPSGISGYKKSKGEETYHMSKMTVYRERKHIYYTVFLLTPFKVIFFV